MKDVERMLISAHADGEVGEPWNQAVAARISQDPAWAAEAELHRRVKQTLAESPEPDFSASGPRVLSRVLERAAPPGPRTLVASWTWMTAAAAALLMVAAGAGFWVGRTSAGPSTTAVQVSELEVQVPKQLELKLNGEGQLLMASTLQRAQR